MNFSLSKRPGKIGPSINTRTEKHGDDDVPGIDIPISGVLLDKEELGELLSDMGALEAIYSRLDEINEHLQGLGSRCRDITMRVLRPRPEVKAGGRNEINHPTAKDARAIQRIHDRIGEINRTTHDLREEIAYLETLDLREKIAYLETL